MVNSKLVRYFEIYTAKGYKHHHLKNHLATLGFHPEEIDEAIRFLQEKGDAPAENARLKTQRMPELMPRRHLVEVKILSSLYFLFALMLFFYSLMLFVTPDALPRSEFLRGIIGTPVSFFAFFLLIVSGVSVFVGYGIWNLQPWARVEGLALSVFAAFTGIGILMTLITIYFFSRKDIRMLFAPNSRQNQSVSSSNSANLP